EACRRRGSDDARGDSRFSDVAWDSNERGDGDGSGAQPAYGRGGGIIKRRKRTNSKRERFSVEPSGSFSSATTRRVVAAKQGTPDDSRAMTRKTVSVNSPWT